MKRIKLNLLTDKLFLLGLITLLVNDLVLKHAVGGWITGKLSDVSGLFIFPFFWSALLPHHRFKVYMLSSIAFVFWKLPLSTEFIDTINHDLGTTFHRVADYTDLLALAIVPFSYKHFTNSIDRVTERQHPRYFPILISIVSLFAFVATSLPRHPVRHKLIVNEMLICNLGKDDIFKNRIKASRFTSDSLERNLADTSFRLSFHIAALHAEAHTWVKIYPIDSTKTVFHIDSLDSYVLKQRKLFNKIDEEDVEDIKRVDREEFIKLFQLYVIQPIQDKRVTDPRIYFDNPKSDTTRFENY